MASERKVTWGVVVLSYKRQRPLGAVIEQHPSSYLLTSQCPTSTSMIALRLTTLIQTSHPGLLPEGRGLYLDRTLVNILSQSWPLWTMTTLPPVRYVLMKVEEYSKADIGIAC